MGSGSQGIDAGNGVVLYVKERSEWVAFMRGYKQQGRRAGELLGEVEREVERGWRGEWRGKCGFGNDEGRGSGIGSLKGGGAGPVWVLVKGVVGRICRGEA